MEWRLAAKAFHLTWDEFCKLPGEEQSAYVAVYRAEQMMEAVVADEQRKRTAAQNRSQRPRAHR